MNPIQFFEYGKSRIAPGVINTFIGGVSSELSTPQLLADKLKNYPSGSAFSVSNIMNFTIVGDNIECYINIDYEYVNLTTYSGNLGNILTYYTDVDNHIKRGFNVWLQTNIPYVNIPGILEISSNAIRETNVVHAIFQNATTLLGGIYTRTFYVALKIEVIYMPNVTQYGDSHTTDSQTFFGMKSGCVIYAHPSMETINNGGLEADLTYARDSRDAIIRYVTNFTAPNPITDLSVGTVFGTAVQLNFTTPISTNAIDYYELYVNGIYSKKIISGNYITGLSTNTSYAFEIIPVDIFYNKSTSNTVNVTTAATEPYPISNMTSYYIMEGNVVDRVGTNNGTATAITYEAGTVGQRALLNGTTSFISIPDSDSLSFNGTNDLPFSISYILKLNVLTSGSQYWIFGKRSGNSIFEYQFSIYNGVCYFDIYDTTNSAYIRNTFSWTLLNTIDTFKITHTYDGLGLNGMSTYINNALVSGTRTAIGTYSSMKNTTSPLLWGKRETGNFLNGSIDEVSIWNTALTLSQISEINAKLNSGQSLI